MSELAGKFILITGAAKRIGRSIASKLHTEGARVVIHYNTSEAAAFETASVCGNAPIYRANLESVAEIRAMFSAINREHGQLDAFVNNAARFTQMDAMRIEEADWDYIHSVNLKAAFFCCQAAARAMGDRGGRIVTISSLGGLRPWASHAHYCASKAGLIMLTEALAKAFAPRISVNSIAPGVIPFSQEEVDSASVRPMIERTPMQRAGSGDDVAAAVAMLLSAPTFITGQTIAVDGGLSLA